MVLTLRLSRAQAMLYRLACDAARDRKALGKGAKAGGGITAYMRLKSLWMHPFVAK